MCHTATLSGLVYGGAALYVFSKSAKFSLFKPAEEMGEGEGGQGGEEGRGRIEVFYE